MIEPARVLLFDRFLKHLLDEGGDSAVHPRIEDLELLARKLLLMHC